MSVDVNPWNIPVDDAAVDDLRARLRGTRWSDEINDESWGWGVDKGYLRELVDAWAVFDWKDRVRRLNDLAHYLADIDGHQIHFVHLQAPESSHDRTRVPLLLLHGWPGSFVEMLSLAPKLQDAAATRGFAFDLVIPSLPGFGFSSRPSRPGTSPEAAAAIFHRLMGALGYQKYGIQGGDLGSGIAVRMSLREPHSVLGIHLNYMSFGVETSWAEQDHEPGPAYDRRREQWSKEEGGYSHVHATRPQTVGYALNDSPTGLAAWIGEKFHAWTDRRAAGGAVPIGLEEILTNLSVYWFTGTITSSMRMYKESAADPLVLSEHRRIEVPLGVSAFPYELPIQPRERVEHVANLVHWTDMPRGGHFAALEAPDLLGEDVSAFFNRLVTKAER
ncbi:epoxide hydrolase family protein [Streptomyces sp. NRRL S-813]|uniref:epoxide hydrolase family protein n=1 Tax=Streptomyces sp. NRRL S-813 TaxID=1463919 RepID=UPI0004C07C57|nr:epoxide hydrolase family protein [Streptomyces sp. NRRL S-813]